MKRSLTTFEEAAAPHAAPSTKKSFTAARLSTRMKIFVLALALLAGLVAFAAPPRVEVQAQRGGDPPPATTPTPAPDDDRDGVANRHDLCPQTPAGLRPVQSGCAAVEIAVQPNVILGPLSEQLEARRTELSQAREFDAAARGVGQARDLVAAAGAELQGGQVCQSAATFERAAGKLRETQASLEDSAVRLTALLAASQARADDTRQQHTTMILVASYREQFAATLDSAASTGRTLSGLCSSATEGWTARGVVTEVNDAARLLKLDTGQVVGLAGGRRYPSLYEGGSVSTSGIGFNDGTGIAFDAGTEPPTWTPDEMPAVKCLQMRIAPIQKNAPPYVLLDPEAYDEGLGVLDLEEGMRIGVHDFKTCAQTTSGGASLRYSLAVEVTQNGKTEYIANELADGDAPTPLPDFLALNTEFSIKTTVMMKKCTDLPGPFDLCEAPLPVATDTYYATIFVRGGFGTINYDQKFFSVVDNGVDGDFQTTKMVSLWAPGAPFNVSLSYEAEGYAVTNGQSSYPQLAVVKEWDEFAVHESFELAEDDPLRVYGLQWPRVVGKRNGKTFWYSAKLPRIVRDVVQDCSVLPPHTFYKFPFKGAWPGAAWTISNGNADDPAPGKHGTGQFYAWDILAPSGTDIRAARGGIVFKAVENEWMNVDQYDLCTEEEMEGLTTQQLYAQCPDNALVGNYLWIRHEDGTIASYNHLLQNSIVPQLGQRVHRGDIVAKVGDTGYSSEPHLHFEVVEKFLGYSWNYHLPLAGPSIRSLFEATMTDTNTTVCGYVPRVGDHFKSTQ